MIKIVFLGTPSFVQPIKDILANKFSLVNSLKDADPDLIGADLGVVAAYGKILTKEELETPKFGCINVHPSLLPKYRGPSPIQQAILNGDKVSGVTIIKMDEEVDHGPIIYQQNLGLSDNDNFDTLSKKMFLLAAEILPQIINDFIQGKIEPVAQNDKEATYCELLTRDSGYFDIDKIPENLEKMIRAYYPWPGVWTKWHGKIVKFLPDGKLQMEGKKVLSKVDFLNGYPDFPLKN